MADFVFNISKGKAGYYASQVGTGNAALIFVLLKTAQTDGTLKDYADLNTLLTTGGGTANVEANFTNYARKTVTANTPSVDNTNDWLTVDVADQTWTSAGGATNNTLVKLLICYDSDTTSGTDANIIPLTAHDFAVTTDGTDLTAQINASGYYKAA